MEVNKEQAEKCRDVGAQAMRQGDYSRAAKFFRKSLQLYPLPGVEALLQQAESRHSTSSNSRQSNESSSSSTTTNNNNSATSSSGGRSSVTESSTQAAADGRAYTQDNVDIVKHILRAKEGGSGAHYRVLGLERDATEAQIKKAYRKLSLKVHPDKNSAPQSDEAFKVVSLAYATLSDPEKRRIYDRYGDEDPDNRGGGMRAGGVHFRPGAEMSPEDIFNAFFGGGFGGPGFGGPGVRVYTNGFGFGPGVHFAAGNGFHRAQRQAQQQQQQQQRPSQALFLQFLPLFIILLLSFFGSQNDMSGTSRNQMPGENKYFSLTLKQPFVNAVHTRLTKVKDIPYYVSDKFLRTYYRDRYQLAQVERMVEQAYRQYLVSECNSQEKYKKRLLSGVEKEPDADKKEKMLKQANEFELNRCTELNDLFPDATRNRR